MTKNADFFRGLEPRNESQKDSQKLEASFLGSAVLHATGSYFVGQLMERDDFYIKICLNSTAFHTVCLYQLSKQLPQKLHCLFDKFNKFMNPTALLTGMRS